MCEPFVLVVDDEADIREGVSTWLTASGFTCEMAANGEECISTIRTHRPRAILLDVRMPKMDGMMALQELKKEVETSTIPVIMLSASLRDQQRALDAGADFFVHKPYEGLSLMSALRAAMKLSRFTSSTAGKTIFKEHSCQT